MKDISKIILNNLENDLLDNSYTNLIVSGGSSPVQIFKDLSTKHIPWSRINISLVDDRIVNENHKDSNEKLVKDLLITDSAKDANFISICNESKNLSNLRRPFNVMLLGMGDDGHFASLFPQLINSNPEYFDPLSRPHIFSTDPLGNPCHRRVSMNLSMILESKNIYLLVSNEKKLEILNKAKNDKSLPLYYLLNQDITKIEIIKDF